MGECVRLDASRRRRQLGGIVVGLIRCRHQNIKIENGVQCVVASAVEAMPLSTGAQVFSVEAACLDNVNPRGHSRVVPGG